jgi:short-subunit dehydrogenase
MRQHYGGWALVAGGGEGLGEAFCRALAREGMNVVVVDMSEARAKACAARLEREFGVYTRRLIVDLSEMDAIEEMDAQTRDLDLGLVVYNACVSSVAPFLDTPLETHQRLVAVNVRAPLESAHRFGERFRERGRGGIIIISSLSGFQGTAPVVSYAASKAFDTVLGEGLWWELRRDGIDVLSCVCGAMKTPTFLQITPRAGQLLTGAMKPRRVAESALDALGKGPVHIPGRVNRLTHALTRHALNRAGAARFFSTLTERIYRAQRAARR